MADMARITITLPLPLKQALAERAQRTGQSQTQVVVQALEGLLAAAEPPSLESLTARIEHLESQMRVLMESRVNPTGPAPTPFPQPSTAPEIPDPVPPADPNLWDPVEHSFDDWLFQIWQRTSIDRTGHPLPWGHPVSVEVIHQLAFYELRYRRFIDRLLTSEAPGLHLLPDETSQLGLGDCRPGAITFDECEPELESSADPDHNGHGPMSPLE